MNTETTKTDGPDITPLKEFVALAVAYIIDTRERMNRPPFMATDSNIKNVVAKSLEVALAELTKEQVLTEHPFVNGTSYEFTPPRQ